VHVTHFAMNSIMPYLYFGGRLEEAIRFYSGFLDIKTEGLMRFSESPDPVPEGMLAPGFEDKVMHSTLRIGDAVIMASDGCDANEAFSGFSLSLTLPDEKEARRVFEGLAGDGRVAMPMGPTFWSPCFGMVTDKFGLSWMVTVPEVKIDAPAPDFP